MLLFSVNHCVCILRLQMVNSTAQIGANKSSCISGRPKFTIAGIPYPAHLRRSPTFAVVPHGKWPMVVTILVFGHQYGVCGVVKYTASIKSAHKIHT